MIRLPKEEKQISFHLYDRTFHSLRTEEIIIVPENNYFSIEKSKILRKILEIIIKLLYLLICYLFLSYYWIDKLIYDIFETLYKSHPKEIVILIIISLLYYLL